MHFHSEAYRIPDFRTVLYLTNLDRKKLTVQKLCSEYYFLRKKIKQKTP